ncbi:SRPBCC family protein [Microvirga sp. GCM10011540]|uniref:SRPBCC family protein n=1 Tax=Microvirga sp. GCM10011540 TaxID=3317338 RepID=UPI003620EA00
MPRVYVSAVMDVTIDEAWNVLRDFNALPVYHRFFKDSHIENDWPADRIGCVRNFRTKEGDDYIREQLLSLSDREHLCCYTIIEASIPLWNYVSEMRLRPVTESRQTFGEWWAEFDTPPEQEEDLVGRVTDTFRFAFEGAAEVAKARRRGAS